MTAVCAILDEVHLPALPAWRLRGFDLRLKRKFGNVCWYHLLADGMHCCFGAGWMLNQIVIRLQVNELLESSLSFSIRVSNLVLHAWLPSVR